MSTEETFTDEMEQIEQAPEVRDDAETDAEKKPNVSVDMKGDLKEFIDLTEQIKGAKEEIKILTERKAELETRILDFMVDNDIPAFNTPSGKISVFQAKSIKPFNKEYLEAKLATKMESSAAKALTEHAFAGRPVTPVNKVKVVPKRG